MYRRFFKRFLDLLVALPLGLISFPIWVCVAALVRLFLGSPVLFSQSRAGLKGVPFQVYKFRSMTNTKDDSGKLLPDEQRLTKFGRFLRATSLDELPQIINIIRGEMSLVGPRPLLLAYVDRYSPEQKRRLDVVPGITGWAQVNGRNAISWEERFALDTWYVDHQNFLIDMKIVLLTLFRVVVPQGITGNGGVMMSEFMGAGDR